MSFNKIVFSEYIKLLSPLKVTQSTSFKNKHSPFLCCKNWHFLSRHHTQADWLLLHLCTNTNYSQQTCFIRMAFLCMLAPTIFFVLSYFTCHIGLTDWTLTYVLLRLSKWTVCLIYLVFLMWCHENISSPSCRYSGFD